MNLRFGGVLEVWKCGTIKSAHYTHSILRVQGMDFANKVRKKAREIRAFTGGKSHDGLGMLSGQGIGEIGEPFRPGPGGIGGLFGTDA